MAGGTRTPNMSIYKPTNGETVYDPSFSSGLDNIDTHDHTGGPTNGVQIPTEGLEDGSVTPPKLSEEILIEATGQTTDDTPTEIDNYDIDEAEAITITGRWVCLKSDTTEAGGGTFVGTFRRPTGGSITQVGTTISDHNDDSTGTPNMTLSADTVNERISLVMNGEAAKTINWHVIYQVVTWPDIT
jgi:hypothetical protein